MNEGGISPGFYTQLRDYAELLDSVLIQLKTGQGSAADSKRQQLSRLLTGTSASVHEMLSARLFQTFVREACKKISAETLGKSLLTDNIGSDVLNALEDLARSFEQERACMFRKLRAQF